MSKNHAALPELIISICISLILYFKIVIDISLGFFLFKNHTFTPFMPLRILRFTNQQTNLQKFSHVPSAHLVGRSNDQQCTSRSFGTLPAIFYMATRKLSLRDNNIRTSIALAFYSFVTMSPASLLIAFNKPTNHRRLIGKTFSPNIDRNILLPHSKIMSVFNSGE